MKQFKIMTTRQKSFLEKTLKCLDISLDEFMEIQNTIEYRKKTDERVAFLEKKIDLLTKALDEQGKSMEVLVDYYNKVATKMNEISVDTIFRQFGGDNDE